MSGEVLCLLDLCEGIKMTGRLEVDVAALLIRHGCRSTLEHSRSVADQAVEIAQAFDVDPEAAHVAGWLHDVSAVVPSGQRLAAARQWGIPILPEEECVPMILHQKLSCVIAEKLFGISSPDILSAVGCHTTLRPGATPLDKAVFIADKLAWDQTQDPPFAKEVSEGLAQSLDQGILSYIHWLYAEPGRLQVVHPWLSQAYGELNEAVRGRYARRDQHDHPERKSSIGNKQDTSSDRPKDSSQYFPGDGR